MQAPSMSTEIARYPLPPDMQAPSMSSEIARYPLPPDE